MKLNTIHTINKYLLNFIFHKCLVETLSIYTFSPFNFSMYSWLSYRTATTPPGISTSGWQKGPPGTQYQPFICGSVINASDWMALVVTNNNSVSYNAYLVLQRPGVPDIYGNIFTIAPNETKFVEIQVPENVSNINLTFKWIVYETGTTNAQFGDETCSGTVGTVSTADLTLSLADATPDYQCNSIMTLALTNLPFLVDNSNASVSYIVKLQAIDSSGTVWYESSTQSISPFNAAAYLVVDFTWLPTTNGLLFFRAVSTEGHGQISNECRLDWQGAVSNVVYNSKINRLRLVGADISEGGTVHYTEDIAQMDLELINTGNQNGNFRVDIIDGAGNVAVELLGRDIVPNNSTWWEFDFQLPQFDTGYSVVSYQFIAGQWQSQDSFGFTIGKTKISTDVITSGFHYTSGITKTSLEPCGSKTITTPISNIGVTIENTAVIPYTISLQLTSSDAETVLISKDFVVNNGQKVELQLPISISNSGTYFVKAVNKTISNAFIGDCNFIYSQCIQNGSNSQGTCCSGLTRCSDGYCKDTCSGTGGCIPYGSNQQGTCCTGTTRCTDGYCKVTCDTGSGGGTCSTSGEFATDTKQCCTGLTKCSDGKCSVTCQCSGIMMGTTCVPTVVLIGGGVMFMMMMMSMMS